MDLLWNWMMLVAATVSVGRVRCADSVVEFSIHEERAVGLELGSLGDDSILPLGLHPSVRGSLRYSLLPQGFPRSSLFRVDEDSGQIFSKERIDRESLCGYDSKCHLDIQVAVQSAVSQFFKKVKVMVKVSDINDNAPTFLRPATQLRMLESVAIGTSFLLEEATDLDIGDFGVKDYQLNSEFGSFSVNVTKGDSGRNLVHLVVRKELDRESTPAQTLVLIARDGGQPSLSGSATIVVNVDDVNDNAPVFDQAFYNTSLPETAVVGTRVASVTATDLDTQPFGIKEYRFSPLDRDDVTKYFAINTSTGDITVVGSLLERQGETFRLLVECIDKGLPPLVSRAEVDITVEDTTNSAPIINLNTMFGGAVSEMAQSGTVVALLGVVDRDAGLNGIVTCSIVSDAFELQALSVNEYKVIVVRGLDREAEPVLEVSVTCQDAGTPPLAGNVRFSVKVKDENDNPPYFSERVYHRTITENTRPGQMLFRVTAEDRDIGDNARITYSLVDASDLRIDTRGNIIAINSLDYEKTRQLKLKVVATDNGAERRSTTVDVVIDVADVNDEFPRFEKAMYEFEVMENMPSNTTVNSVVATDRDSGENGKIQYTISQTDIPFDILPNGAIVTKDNLDREKCERYRLIIYAEDRGQPSLTGTTTVVITVGDQNDHIPRIVYPRSGNSSVIVAFASKPGSIVLNVLSEDGDAGPNKQLEYHLASGSGRSMFELSKDKGELILRRALTLQDVGRHRLTVVVTDQSPVYPLASNSSFDVIIFAPNETESPAKDKEKEHIMVVIILGVITGVVTVAVIITIAIIRRADLQRRKYLQGRVKINRNIEKLEAEKISVGYVISNSVPDGSKSKGVQDDGKGSKDLTDSGFGDKTLHTSHCSVAASDQAELSRAFRLHQDLLRLHGIDAARLGQSGASDDVTSDGSGESTTCDSGRGGSEDDTGSHGRQSPLHKDTALMNNLSDPRKTNRPQSRQQVHNIPRPGFTNLMPRQIGCLPDTKLQPQPVVRSVCTPPVKHVSFSDDFRQELSELLPPHLRVQGLARDLSGGCWESSMAAPTACHPHRYNELKLTIDHSYDTAEDGNSTTTSGSYTVDDLSPRMSATSYTADGLSPRISATSYMPEQALV